MSAVNTIVEQFNVLEDLPRLVFGNYGGERSRSLSELKKLSATALS